MSGNLDKTQSIQQFIKKKFIVELAKGVASMHEFIYPTVLQSAAIPVIKKSESKNIIIRYNEMTGIKLTLLLPIINQQIQYVIKRIQAEDDDQTIVYSLFICHTN